MKSNKYTLDRFEGDFAVFLKHPNETETLLIKCSKLNNSLTEGDLVSISVMNEEYKIELMEKETAQQRDKIQQLLEELKNNR